MQNLVQVGQRIQILKNSPTPNWLSNDFFIKTNENEKKYNLCYIKKKKVFVSKNHNILIPFDFIDFPALYRKRFSYFFYEPDRFAA